jgi:hypothetical protein
MALHQALDLLRRPMLAGLMRDQPLPRDVLMLLQMAANDEAALQRATEMTSESPARIREAALLWLQNVLMTSKVDHYRVLGLDAAASQEQIREHLTWLMKWLHPDRTRSEWDSAFARRVLAAWDALKTPERRAAYDLTVKQSAGGSRALVPVRRQRIVRPAPRIPWIARPPERPTWRVRLLRGVTAVVSAALVGLGVMGSGWIARVRHRLVSQPSAAEASGVIHAQTVEVAKDSGTASVQPAAQ